MNTTVSVIMMRKNFGMVRSGPAKAAGHSTLSMVSSLAGAGTAGAARPDWEWSWGWQRRPGSLVGSGRGSIWGGDAGNGGARRTVHFLRASTFPTMNTSFLKNLRASLIALVALGLGALAFTGCQTMEGAGKDIERAGEKIQENAEKHN
jgi:predicted small secreted protein